VRITTHRFVCHRREQQENCSPKRIFQQPARSAAPKPRGGSVSPLERQAEQVVAVITDQPDLSLEETAAELRRHRIRTSRSALSRFFHRHDFTFKKKLASC